MEYRECYEKARRILAEAKIAEADLDARLLLEFACGTDRNDLLAHGNRPVPAGQQERFEGLIAERARHIPLQHLTGSQNFMGLDFQVNGHVMIPRQDTEILAEEVMRQMQDGFRILDMCTGSGCILISLLHYSNHCAGVGADISARALEIAAANARRLLGEHNQAQFIQSDLFENVEGRFDIIVSNPPYIPTAMIPELMPEVRDHEPPVALDGGEDGLFFYREIIAGSKDYLMRGGKLFFEIGFDQAEAVAELLAASGFQEIMTVQDYAGLDRVVYGTLIKEAGG